jgi:hypothetical protein
MSLDDQMDEAFRAYQRAHQQSENYAQEAAQHWDRWRRMDRGAPILTEADLKPAADIRREMFLAGGRDAYEKKMRMKR